MNAPSHFSFHLNETQQVRIAITDLLGRTIREVLNETMHAGKHTINIPDENLHDGSYFLLLQSGSDNRMTKISVAH